MTIIKNVPQTVETLKNSIKLMNSKKESLKNEKKIEKKESDDDAKTEPSK